MTAEDATFFKARSNALNLRGNSLARTSLMSWLSINTANTPISRHWIAAQTPLLSKNSLFLQLSQRSTPHGYLNSELGAHYRQNVLYMPILSIIRKIWNFSISIVESRLH